MTEKILNARIINKHDIADNWSKAVNFVPKQGEIIIYDVDENHNYTRIKIGDGSQNVNSLPFVDDTVKDLININSINLDTMLKEVLV